MDALILSCSTGGGHNAAGYAVKEELERRGHHVTMLDPYSLAGKQLDKKVGDGYIKMAQKTPRFFGFIYQLGDWYRRLPIHSPVYRVNKAMYHTMKAFLESRHFDLILIPHIYPGEILTYLKNRGVKLPKIIFIATDYACIPFTEEIDCDYYVIPSPELNADFIRRGIAPEKLVPAGIPVRREFGENISAEDAKRKLGLDPGKHYILLSGGSIGAGEIDRTVSVLCSYLSPRPDRHLIVVCGNNKKLYSRLRRKYGGRANITLLECTADMALYMKACDAFLSKPGGLSSTEAAVSGIPLIHISPIPGCEEKNMKFFASHGMSVAVGDRLDMLNFALSGIGSSACRDKMKQDQKLHIPRSATESICDLAEDILSGNQSINA